MPAHATAQQNTTFRLRPDGRVASWNDRAARLLGYSADEAIDRYFAWFFPMAEVQRGESERVLRLAGASGLHESEGWRLRKDDSRFWARVAVAAIRDEAGHLEGFAVVTFAG